MNDDNGFDQNSKAQSGLSVAMQLGFQIVIGPIVFFIAATQVGKYFGHTAPLTLAAIVFSLVWMVYQSIRIMGKGGK